MTNHTDIFQHYYRDNFWGNAVSSSGPNSDYRFTPQLCKALQTLFDTLQPKNILDAGCGDANLFRHIDIGKTPYLGLDCVPELIEKCQSSFSDKQTMHFDVADVVTAPLPQAELVISRDVVHYLPNDLIQQLLDNILASGAQYLLITHNTHCSNSANDPTEIGKFRPVNLTYPPFNFPQPNQTIAEDFLAKELALWKLPIK